MEFYTHKFKVGDTLEIIDRQGDDCGLERDQCKVVEIEGKTESAIITCILLTGKNSGQETSRYAHRFKLIESNQWDE